MLRRGARRRVINNEPPKKTLDERLEELEKNLTEDKIDKIDKINKMDALENEIDELKHPYKKYDVIIVGGGISGIVIAEQFANKSNKNILIIDKRNHIAGNCYDYTDYPTGIRMNKYGAHLFHTNDEVVYEYITKYGEWEKWEHKVVGDIDGSYLPIPANIDTVNGICNEKIKNEEEMNKWLEDNQVKYDDIKNGEQMAKSRVGEVLYEKIFKHYTYKQWKRYPEELDPEVLARIPVRNSFDDRYFSDKYQVLPKNGYTHFFQGILDKFPQITIQLNTDFEDLRNHISNEQIVIYTGPIDAYFSDKNLPKLEYRSIDFEIDYKFNEEYYQPNSVVNYPGENTKYTRCVEYKHFLNQKSDHTVIVKETTTDKGEPYYPVLNEKNKSLYKIYQELAEKEGENVHFLGRLASYKYFNMDQAIKNSLDYYKDHFIKPITLVVSRYNENVEWINEIKDNTLIGKILIFNKGRKKISFSDNKIKVNNVKNIGREGGTYLDYIIDNYGNFPENLIFTQADPFEHNEKFLDFFKDENVTLYYNSKDILPLTKQWKVRENIPPQEFVKYNNSYNISNLELIRYFVRDYDQQTIGHSSFHDSGIADMYKTFIRTYKSKNIFDTICEFVGIEKSKHIIPICLCACFFLKSKQIMRHPKEVYIKLRNFLYNSKDQGGIEGYILERFWYYLFTGESFHTIEECLKELFIDIEPLICVFSENEKLVTYKIYNKDYKILEDKDKYLIYTKNGQRKILPGINMVEIEEIVSLPTKSIEDSINIFKLVISRYNEDIKWSSIYSNNRIIYNKGDELDDKLITPCDKYIKLPNVGRESDTFLNYIIENYENLPSYVCFSQGSLKDHGWIRGDWGRQMFWNMLQEAQNKGCSKYKMYDIHNNTFGLNFDNRSAYKYDKEKNLNDKGRINNFRDFIVKIYPEIVNEKKINVFPSAFMVISRDNILKRSKESYKDLIHYCNYHINPIEGHYFERSWYYIFNLHLNI